MSETIVRAAVAIAAGVLTLWLSLVILLLVARPKGVSLKDLARLLPDTVRLLKRLAADPSVSRGVRVRLVLLFVYLALPFDLIPDFLPVIGYAEDAIIVALTLRSVVRIAGPDALRRHWPGTDAGLEALWQLARLPGRPPPAQNS